MAKTQITAEPGVPQIIMTCEFDAPRDLVYARYTRSRGASNSQVMMICGMPGSAVICVLAIVVSSRPGP